MSDDEWHDSSVAAKKKKNAQRKKKNSQVIGNQYTKELADQLETNLNITGLSNALRSGLVHKLLGEGWKYHRVLKGQEKMHSPTYPRETGYSYVDYPVNNGYNDSIILRK